jgi:O-methyltransferase
MFRSIVKTPVVDGFSNLKEKALRVARTRRAGALNGVANGATSPGGELASLEAADRAIVERALPHTMTGVPRLLALIDAVRYLERRGVPGGFAECGVWRGGSVLAMIETLRGAGAAPRDIWLYDTFEGMTEPTDQDVSAFEPPALETWRAATARGERPWADLFSAAMFDEASVRDTLVATGYAPERLHFVRGPVEETLPRHMPEGPLALLRLDTDWYESTRHELAHLYPRLVSGGILIIDDYGHFEGARRAVDEYFAQGEPLLLTRIDYTGRLAVKP